jgi:hypothetical protein
MSTAQLNRARQMQKLAERVDRVTQAYGGFFDRFPHRLHRVRLASHAEIGHFELLTGEPMFVHKGCRIFTVIRNVAPGIRLRLYTQNVEGSETDLDEATALAIFEMTATPYTRKIEAEMRKAVEART